MKNANQSLPILLFFSFLLLSCSNSQNQELILGDWVGSEWNVNGKATILSEENTFFTFENNGKYSMRFAGNKEEGTYMVKNDKLFTTPKLQQEIMVKIAKLTVDSLVFDMNRGGQPETLTLLRK